MHVADHGRIERDHVRPGSLRLASCRREWLIGDHPGAVGEPCDGVSAGGALSRNNQVDGVAAVGVVSGPAAPSLVSPVVCVQGDRGVLVVVVGHRAVPAATADVVGGGRCELVEEL